MSIEKRDLIKDEIERIGKMIGRILERLMGKDSALVDPIISEQINEQLKGELDLDIDSLVLIPNEDFIQEISTRFHQDETAMEQFADLLLVYKNDHKSPVNNYSEKARILLVHIQDQSLVYSIDRQYKINGIPSNNT